jgi:tRNA-dihydrouridine synthase 4
MHQSMACLYVFPEGSVLKNLLLVQIAAPMVRFSKLPFRHVVRSWGSDIVFTPMIMANSFVNSAKARDVEFTTNANDR